MPLLRERSFVFPTFVSFSHFKFPVVVSTASILSGSNSPIILGVSEEEPKVKDPAEEGVGAEPL